MKFRISKIFQGFIDSGKLTPGESKIVDFLRLLDEQDLIIISEAIKTFVVDDGEISPDVFYLCYKLLEMEWGDKPRSEDIDPHYYYGIGSLALAVLMEQKELIKIQEAEIKRGKVYCLALPMGDFKGFMARIDRALFLKEHNN